MYACLKGPSFESVAEEGPETGLISFINWLTHPLVKGRKILSRTQLHLFSLQTFACVPIVFL